jgi:hypothetical protein
MGVDNWKQCLQQYSRISDASKKLATFLTVIGPLAYTLLSSLLAQEKPATKTHDELVPSVIPL